MKAAFYTLGCRVNSYDTQNMIEQFKENGYEIVSHNDIADVYIINTCAVTNESERKSKQIVRRLKKKNANSITVLTGCLGQSNFEEAKKVTSADIVCGTHKRDKILQYIEDFKNKHEKIHILEKDDDKFDKRCITTYEGKSRAFIKIQDGCNMFCTYCIIPYARGILKNASVHNVLTQVKNLKSAGYKEVVVTGIHVASYKADTGENLIDLLEKINEYTPVERIRLGSLEPKLLSEKFLYRLSKINSFCPNFHISLQSGCDNVLKGMNRKYNTKEYKEICNRIYRFFPEASITTDIIVGFPGETEEDFLETKAYLKNIGFSFVHIFPYSPKHGTPAAAMDNQVPENIKHDRAKRLKEEMLKVRNEYLKEMIGKNVKILIEKELEPGTYAGYTRNYIYTTIKSDKNLFNEIIDAKITAVNGDNLICELK